jgi:muramoyltetrapeptide carboxypeptidase
MNRKHFLSSFIAAATVLPAFKTLANTVENESSSFKIPPYLKPGDSIGITSPAGYITSEQIQPSVLQMQSWGFTIKIGDTIGKRDFTYGGTDEERLADFQQMLDDPTIKAIMCARGGYGFVRIIDKLDFSSCSKEAQNGLLALVILPFCIVIWQKIMAFLLSTPKCAIVFQMTGVKQNRYRLKQFYP